MKKILLCTLVVLAVIGCTDATVVSSNLSKKAEMFELNRRIVFYNGITGEYMLVINGLCSVSSTSAQLAVTCKTGPDSYKKHYLGLSDNVTYFSEQVEDSAVSKYHYKVIFKPAAIVPDVDLQL